MNFFLKTIERYKHPGVYGIIKRFQIPTNFVLHVGGNIGQEANDYDALNFKQILWVEGYPPSVKKLKENLKDKKNHKIIECMVSDIPEEKVNFTVTYNVLKPDDESSSTMLTPTHSWHTDLSWIKVKKKLRLKCSRLDYVLPKKVDNNILNNLDLIVFDIEGSELKALRSLGDIINFPKFAIIESSIKENFVNGPLLRDIDNFMFEKNFRRIWFKTIGTQGGDAVYQRVRKVGALHKIYMKLNSLFLYIFAKSKLIVLWIRFKILVKKITNYKG